MAKNNPVMCFKEKKTRKAEMPLLKISMKHTLLKLKTERKRKRAKNKIVSDYDYNTYR